MKIKIILTALTLGASAWMAAAQEDAPKPPGGPGQGQRPMPPLHAALDANHDGTMDADEISNASAALKTLDKNSDGKLAREELMPARPEGGRPDGVRPEGGPGKRQGPGGQGGDQQRPPREPGQGGFGQGGQGGPGHGGPGQGGPGQGQRPMPPMVSALDANHDGTIDETELGNATAALKTLDKNSDGKLTREELMPARPEGGRPGGPGGPGGRKGPPGENN